MRACFFSIYEHDFQRHRHMPVRNDGVFHRIASVPVACSGPHSPSVRDGRRIVDPAHEVLVEPGVVHHTLVVPVEVLLVEESERAAVHARVVVEYPAVVGHRAVMVLVDDHQLGVPLSEPVEVLGREVDVVLPVQGLLCQGAPLAAPVSWIRADYLPGGDLYCS